MLTVLIVLLKWQQHGCAFREADTHRGPDASGDRCTVLAIHGRVPVSSDPLLRQRVPWRPVSLHVLTWASSFLQMYNFTSFAMVLNEVDKDMESVIPKTDCRLRPDIRAMENGEIGTWRGRCCWESFLWGDAWFCSCG